MKTRFLAYFLCLGMLFAGVSCSLNPRHESDKPQAAPDPHLMHLDAHGIDHANWPEHTKELLTNAVKLSGIRYRYGGGSPETGFDCSGFVRYVYAQAINLNLPHSARAISQIGNSIAKHELQPGDLVFFNTLKSAFSHVGIYLGNNRFIHAPSSGGSVRVEDMQQTYWKTRFNGAQRIEASSK